MTQTTQISAELRDRAGKGTARATRRAGKTPAVLYGNKQPPVLLAIDAKEIETVSRRAGFFTRLFELKVGNDTFQALARDAQRDPVSEYLVHVDFLRIDPKAKIRIDVPVKFANTDKSPGIKRGGVLNIVAHTVEVWCAATKIPESLAIDVTGLEINDSIHASTLKLPEGVELYEDEDFTVATIAAPSAIRSEMREKAEQAAAPAAATPAAAAPAAAGAKPAPGAAPAPAAAAKAAPAKAPAKK
jgi:large subunit ribosomal protein L25